MLFTGSGRHRRRTQTEKVIAVAGVAGVGLALPLLTVTGAHAAPVDTWERVAQCESGGNWSINTGNGFYGGLQFTPSTWKAFGGQSYAAQAHQASKGQQIAVAEKVLASQGPGAWPVCSVKAGLTKGGSAAAVDTSADRASRSEARATAPKATPKATAPKQQTAPKPATPKVDAPTVSTPKHAAPAPATGGYTVRSGDTLSGIAAAHGQDWHQLYQANRAVIGGDPDLILPGQVLGLG